MFEIQVTTSKGTKVSRHIIENGSLAIGKSRDNDIVLQGWKIARNHADLVVEDKGLFVRDRSNKQTLEINGARMAQYGPIDIRDSIRIGDYLLKISRPQKEVSQPADGTPHAVAGDGGAARARVAGAVAAEQGADTTSPDSILEMKKAVHAGVFRIMDLRRTDISRMSDEELREFTSSAIWTVLADMKDVPPDVDRQDVARRVLAEAVGLGPLEELLERDDITEIMVNSHDEIFYEQAGKLMKSKVTFTDDASVIKAIERIVSPIGRRIDESSPMVDARLKDGSRVNAVIPPLTLKGPSVTIRKFMKERLTADSLIKFGSIDANMVEFMRMAVEKKKNIVISGGTGSGKTTLLNVLSNFIPNDERIVTVEDAAELKLYQPNLVAMEARPSNQEGKGAVTIRDLVKNCLRMRPDRIVVGECRGGEALDMLQAMNTGHDGSLTTIHANSPRDCISRMEVLVLMSGMELPVLAIREQIASAVDVIVQQTRFACGSRRVTSIAEVTGVECGTVQLAEIFRFQQEGYDENGKVRGKFMATGLIPEFYDQLRRRGIAVDLSIFSLGIDE